MSELEGKKPFAGGEYVDPAGQNGINDGYEFERSDAMFAEDVNKIIENQMYLKAKKADLNSPILTGTPIAPTSAASTDSPQIATTSFTQSAISARRSEESPKMDGAASVGADNFNFAREGHVHPTDISREPIFTKNTAFNKSFETTAANIKMNGAVSVGTSESIAKADHVHPTDTSREPIFTKNTAFNKNFETTAANIKMNGAVSVGTSESIAKADHVHPTDATREPIFTKNTAFNKNFETATANIKMNGAASVGSSESIAKADHVHPTDTTREPIFTKNTAFNKNFETATANIKMNGAVSVGSSTNIARADHVHPSDDNKVNKNSAITAATKCKITYDAKGLVTSGVELAATDIPNLDTIKLTSGTLPIIRGGTGAIDAAAARTSLGITLSNLGGAAASHAHAATEITSGTLPLARGGTGGTDPATARASLGITLNSLGAATENHIHAATDITSGTLPLARGGTGATDAATARISLGLNNLNNTSDLSKPISTATQAALDNKANISGTYPNLTVGNATNATQLGGVAPSGYVNTTGAQTIGGTKTFTGNVRLQSGSTANSGGKINFGDGDYVYLHENSNDSLTIKATTLNLNASAISLTGTGKIAASQISITNGGSFGNTLQDALNYISSVFNGTNIVKLSASTITSNGTITGNTVTTTNLNVG